MPCHVFMLFSFSLTHITTFLLSQLLPRSLSFSFNHSLSLRFEHSIIFSFLFNFELPQHLILFSHPYPHLCSILHCTPLFLPTPILSHISSLVSSRTPVPQELGGGSTEDDITVKLQEIIEVSVIVNIFYSRFIM